MKNVIILGANGGLAQTVIPTLLENPAIKLTLFSRNVQNLARFSGERVAIVQGDVMNLAQLEQALAGQDIVYANLAGNLEPMAKNVVLAMKNVGIKRLIWISSMGIYGETGEDHGAILDPYRHSAAVVEASGLDYTVIRPGWFTNGSEIDYQLTKKGEPFKGHSVSKRSIAALISKLIDRPEFAIGESLGIARV